VDLPEAEPLALASEDSPQSFCLPVLQLSEPSFSPFVVTL
jgi:hypothetical protein